MTFGHVVDAISKAFELVGVAIIVLGATWAFARFVSALLRHEATTRRYQAFRRDLGRAILVGLEVLVAADIIRTVAIDPSFTSIGVLGLLVLVRTFLSWSLEVEIHGRWPWQQAQALQQPTAPPAVRAQAPLDRAGADTWESAPPPMKPGQEAGTHALGNSPLCT
jgi:uncharacterized membrane protein